MMEIGRPSLSKWRPCKLNKGHIFQRKRIGSLYAILESRIFSATNAGVVKNRV